MEDRVEVEVGPSELDRTKIEEGGHSGRREGKLTKQSFRLHRKLVLGREGLIAALNAPPGTKPNGGGSGGGWAEKFTELTLRETSSESSNLLSSEVNVTSLELLMIEVVSNFLLQDTLRYGAPLELTPLNSKPTSIKSPPLSINPPPPPRPRSATTSSFPTALTSPPPLPSLKSHPTSITSTFAPPSTPGWDLSREVTESFLNRKEELFAKLETIGFRVGLGLVERFTLDHPPFTDTLDAMKYLCKEFWSLLFHKQIDNLKTNHKGVYVLTDVRFPWITRITSTGTSNPLGQATTYTWFPCGLIRGALAGLGHTAVVVAEAPTPPLCKFPP